MRPVLARKSCLDCHEGAKAGDVLGVMVYAIEKNAVEKDAAETAVARNDDENDAAHDVVQRNAAAAPPLVAPPLAAAPLAAPHRAGIVEAGPRQPGGLLRDRLGEYLTIEGTLAKGAKIETGTLLVDTVDGKKLAKPVAVLVRNLKFSATRPHGEAKQRFVLKGYESGEMIGVAPAVWTAAREQGWKDVNPSPFPWQWRPYFVALVAVEPEGLELDKPWALKP
jgi:hypothetical protein